MPNKSLCFELVHKRSQQLVNRDSPVLQTLILTSFHQGHLLWSIIVLSIAISTSHALSATKQNITVHLILAHLVLVFRSAHGSFIVSFPNCRGVLPYLFPE